MKTKQQQLIEANLIEGLCKILGSLINIHDDNIATVTNSIIAEIAVVNPDETIRTDPVNSLAMLLYHIANTDNDIPEDIATIVIAFRDLEVMTRTMVINLKIALKVMKYLSSNNIDIYEGHALTLEINEFIQEMHFDYSNTIALLAASASEAEYDAAETGSGERTRTSTMNSASSLPIEIPVNTSSSHQTLDSFTLNYTAPAPAPALFLDASITEPQEEDPLGAIFDYYFLGGHGC